ncbi:MAG: alcohol dehydrogenase catalytic domain-containing protein [Promethearchaeota archaeon]
MKALVLDEIGLNFKYDYPVPRVGKEDLLIRVKATGICGTDVAIVKRSLDVPLPIIPGHEIAGIVEAAGELVPEKAKDLVGTLVTTEINANTCGECEFCIAGIPTQCTRRKAIGIDINGGMAEYIAVKHDLVHQLPETMSPEEGTLIEPLAAAIQTFEMMELSANDMKVLILGDGKLALLIMQVIHALRRDPKQSFKGEVMVVGHHESKLALAKKYGADNILNSANISEKSLYKQVNHFSGKSGVDVTIEASGNPRALNQAVDLTRPRGKISLKSTHGVPVPFNLTLAVVKEITLYTSRCGPFDKAIKLYRDGLVDLESLISATYPIARGREAFKDLDYRRDAIKYIINP